MAGSFSGYERELKGVLQGEGDALARYRKYAQTPEELELLRSLEERPFLVVRAAGSQGFDLVALRDRVVLPIEVKSSSQPRIPFASASGRSQDQYHTLKDQTRRSGLMLLYAYRLLGGGERDPWRLFLAEAPVEDHNRYAKMIAAQLPPVGVTGQGNQVLRWEEGKPLLHFLNWVHSVLLGTA
ncbi:MAG: Holliday junction resolvase [Euryarchaeota archaeon]|nr:Holliday junction resolvase [Euryarchaeota archaeon]MDE1835331.1 Holliday junction resolvase [Euryarchaeota archaeon]MDE1880774.1 Holliday junction resolvase [Euryarchaeota archaeon]MDE2043627.1 Holliday junction resolvase [Thermoplasmata archaeon]